MRRWCREIATVWYYESKWHVAIGLQWNDLSLSAYRSLIQWRAQVLYISKQKLKVDSYFKDFNKDCTILKFVTSSIFFGIIELGVRFQSRSSISIDYSPTLVTLVSPSRKKRKHITLLPKHSWKMTRRNLTSESTVRCSSLKNRTIAVVSPEDCRMMRRIRLTHYILFTKHWTLSTTSDRGEFNIHLLDGTCRNCESKLSKCR